MTSLLTRGESMTHQTDQQPTLVLGGTGKTVPTRLGSRNAEPPFDWEVKT